MSDLTIRAWNFRGIEHLDWSPRGVCLLSGPNGAGKTTVLAALEFVRNVFLRGVSEAIRFAGEAEALRNLRAAPDADVVFELQSGDVVWRLEIPIEGRGVHSYHGERLLRGGQVVLDVPRLQKSYTLAGKVRERESEDRVYIQILSAVEPAGWLGFFQRRVGAMRTYDFMFHDPLPADFPGGPSALLAWGGNLIPVLSEWKTAPRRNKGRFEWVLAHLKRAFPDVLEDIEFLPDGRAVFYPTRAPDPDATLPLHLAPAGLLTGLRQLTAVAGAEDGALLGFDEVENQLHPHAIRTILKAMRERAEEMDLSIVLTTHSPVVMDEFKGHEDQFYVLERNPGHSVPVPLTEVRDPEWLAHFALGDLYEREEIAPQQVGAEG
jgi:hypothetical protein